VVQVEDVGAERTGVPEGRAPSADVSLELEIVVSREDPVGRSRAILVGGMHRDNAATFAGLRRIRFSKGRTEVHHAQIEARVEASGVAVIAEVVSRT
jgi:hypothetical protein